ncbi:MAG: alpha-L-fucosidase [Armatimonadota bacterium]
MKSNTVISGTLAALLLISPLAAQTPRSTSAATDGARKEKSIVTAADSKMPSWWRESMQNHEQRIGWWREARLGMFIHWGVYSDLAGEWKGKEVGGYAEHIQRKEKIPIAVYRKEVAEKFSPTKFDADAWARAAKEAGMGYLIITAKHHDGFAMYDSKVSDYNVVKVSAWHHDPMVDLKAACRKHGIKFGFYYSHAFDWGDAEGPGNDWEYDNPGGDLKLHGGTEWYKQHPELLPKVRRYVDRKSIPQIQELIQRYQPDIMWFDTPHKLPQEENLRILEAVRKAGPEVVVNGRLMRGMGDYANTADRPAEFPPTTGDWEAIPTTNESYGYSKTDHSHKSPAHFVQLIAKAAARGGNLLLNIGPKGDGTFDSKDTEILTGVGKWMAVNQESIRGTKRTPLAPQSWGESTRRGDRLYLHVFDWPKDGSLIVSGLKSPVTRAYLLSDKKRTPLSTERLNSLDIRIQVSPDAPDTMDSVVVLETSKIAADASVRLLAPSSINTLRVFDGQIRGKTLRFGPGKVTDAYVSPWSDPAESVTWAVRVLQPAAYDVAVTYDAEPASADGTFSLTVAGQALMGKVAPGKMQKVSLGRIRLSPGESWEIRVLPVSIKGTELMRLRSVILTPAAGE